MKLRSLIAASAIAASAPAGQNPRVADLDYAAPPARSEAGLPIGNGRMGTLIWTDAHALHLQINRVDVFAVSGASRSFPQRDTDPCGGCAAIDIRFAGDPVFPLSGMHEHLECATGLATLHGLGVDVALLASMEGDVIAVEIADHRPGLPPARLAVRSLRPAEVRRADHLSRTNSTERDGAVVLEQTFSEGDFFCASAVAAASIAPASHAPQRIRIGSAATFGRSESPVTAALAAERRAAAAPFAALLAANSRWWRAFWDRSGIRLHSADGTADRIEAAYAWYLYVMASTSRGAYPAKFNGMLWTTGGDLRRWGGAYWGANQSCLYNNALFAADHGELMDSFYAMHTRMIPAEQRAAREEWGSEGIYFPETVTFDGLAPLPPAIAAEMRDLYLLRKPWADRSAAFRAYAGAMQPYTSRWNFINGGRWENGRWLYAERGSGPFGPTSHILSRGAKIAYQYWQRYEYTQDRAWLRESAYPVLRGVIDFYLHFPNFQRESDGRWHIHGVNSNEGLWGGRDPDEEIASLQGLLPTLIRASEILGVDADQRAAWEEIKDHLAPLPRSDLPGVFLPVDNPKPVWQRAFEPVVVGRFSALPDANTLPQWFFDGCSLESPAAVQTIGRDTLEALRHRRRSAGTTAPPRPRRGFGVLSKLPLAAAELGEADAFQEMIVAQMLGGETPVLENRMDLREGAQTQGVERLGNGADALHAALCLDSPPSPGEAPVLRPFAAWPRAWDAEFRLVCRGDFVVEGSQKGGRIGAIVVTSRAGAQLRLVSPWPATEIRLPRAPIRRAQEGVIVLPTRPGERIAFLPASKN